MIIRLIKCLDIYIQKWLSFHIFLDNLFVCLKSVIILKEREITVTDIVRKRTSEYPPRLLQLKKINRDIIWGTLQVSVIGGVCCWLWQDSNAVMSKFFSSISLFLFFLCQFFFWNSEKMLLFRTNFKLLNDLSPGFFRSDLVELLVILLYAFWILFYCLSFFCLSFFYLNFFYLKFFCLSFFCLSFLCKILQKMFSDAENLGFFYDFDLKFFPSNLEQLLMISYYSSLISFILMGLSNFYIIFNIFTYI